MTTDSAARVPRGQVLSGMTFALASAGVSTYITGKFARVFAGIGGELPGLTRLVIDYQWLVWMLPLTVLLLALFSANKARGERSFNVGLFGGLALCAFVLVALYLPLLSMGAVVETAI